MVLLRTVPSAFHARVLAARLGADGIVTELRGPGDGPYPMGEVRVFVRSADLTVATDLLLADEVEAAFELPQEPAGGVPRLAPILVALAVVLLVALAVTTRVI